MLETGTDQQMAQLHKRLMMMMMIMMMMNVRFEVLKAVLLKFQFFRDVRLFRNVGNLPTFRKIIVQAILIGAPHPQGGGTMILRDSDKYLPVDTP